MHHIHVFFSGHVTLPPASFCCHRPQWSALKSFIPQPPPALALFSKSVFCAIFPVTLHILPQTSQAYNICWISYLLGSLTRIMVIMFYLSNEACLASYTIQTRFWILFPLEMIPSHFWPTCRYRPKSYLPDPSAIPTPVSLYIYVHVFPLHSSERNKSYLPTPSSPLPQKGLLQGQAVPL